MLDLIQNNQAIAYPLIIFLLKAPELCINALRIILTAKGYKFYSAVLIFIEACLGITALSLVFSKLDNPINILSFGIGMASGSYLGIMLEKKIALGVVLVRVITKIPADDLLTNLRKLGYRVTAVSGEGNYGKVGILFGVVKRNNTTAFIQIVTRYNPNAFYTIEEISHVSQTISRNADPEKITPASEKVATPASEKVDSDQTTATQVMKRSIHSLTKFFPLKF